MRIAYLAAGAAGMYCGSCLHDNALAKALLDRGEDVLLVPTYTPMRTETPSVAQSRVFVGGVSAYLKQASPWFRSAPRWIDRLLTGWLDQPWLLRLATRGSGSVDPTELGPLTVSMLRGDEGNQATQLATLADWLVDEVRPDVMHLSNSMLLGIAGLIAKRNGPPIVCALSGEDHFLDRLASPHREEALALLRERAAEVAAFTTLGGAYADRMGDYLAVPRERMHVVPHGLAIDDVTPREYPTDDGRHDDDRQVDREHPTRGYADGPPRELLVGYLARVAPEKGLHLLVEACSLLAERRPDLPLRVRSAGYLGAGDHGYAIDACHRAMTGPLAGRYRYHGELTRAEKFDFLRGLDVFATPTIHPEAKGLPAMEALAAGVPAVLPDHGAFPELATGAGGVVLHTPGDAASLADALEGLLDDADTRRRLGQTGAAAIRERYTAKRMVEETLAVYAGLLGETRGAGSASG